MLPRIAEQATIDGIGKVKHIQPLFLQVALRDDDKPEEFTFSKPWKCPLVIINLADSNQALLNVKFLVADCYLTSVYIIIGLPVIIHLFVDIEILLERNRTSLDGTGC